MRKGLRKIILYPDGKTPVLVRLGCCKKMAWVGWLINNRDLFLTALEAGSPGSGCRHGWVLVRTLLPVTDFLFCPHVAEGLRELSGVSFIRH